MTGQLRQLLSPNECMHAEGEITRCYQETLQVVIFKDYCALLTSRILYVLLTATSPNASELTTLLTTFVTGFLTFLWHIRMVLFYNDT